MARRTSRSSKPAPRKRATKRRLRGRRSSAVLLRWCVLAAAGFIGFLYYQPVSSYFETRSSLEQRAAEVQQLKGGAEPSRGTPGRLDDRIGAVA